MPAAPEDWRLRGQEAYLRGARLTYRRYRATSARWEHEHCEFCWQKFLDAEYSAQHRGALEDGSDVEPAGYANLAADGVPTGEWWICQGCYDDFHEEFGWIAVDTDRDLRLE